MTGANRPGYASPSDSPSARAAFRCPPPVSAIRKSTGSGVVAEPQACLAPDMSPSCWPGAQPVVSQGATFDSTSGRHRCPLSTALVAGLLPSARGTLVRTGAVRPTRGPGSDEVQAEAVTQECHSGQYGRRTGACCWAGEDGHLCFPSGSMTVRPGGPSCSDRPGRPSLAAPAAGVVRLLGTLGCAPRRRRTCPQIRPEQQPSPPSGDPRTTIICMRRPPTVIAAVTTQICLRASAGFRRRRCSRWARSSPSAAHASRPREAGHPAPEVSTQQFCCRIYRGGTTSCGRSGKPAAWASSGGSRLSRRVLRVLRYLGSMRRIGVQGSHGQTRTCAGWRGCHRHCLGDRPDRRAGRWASTWPQLT